MMHGPYWIAHCPRCAREAYPADDHTQPLLMEMGMEYSACFGPLRVRDDQHPATRFILVEQVPAGDHPTTDWTTRHARALIFAAINSEK